MLRPLITVQKIGARTSACAGRPTTMRFPPGRRYSSACSYAAPCTLPMMSICGTLSLNQGLTEVAETSAAWGPSPPAASRMSFTRSFVSRKSTHFSAPSFRHNSFFSAPVSRRCLFADKITKGTTETNSPTATTRSPKPYTAYWTAENVISCVRCYCGRGWEDEPRCPRPPPAPGRTIQSPGFVWLFFSAR